MNRFNRLVQKQYSLFRLGPIGLIASQLLYRLIRWYYHCDIPYTLNIKGVYFCHKGFGIVINGNSKIGKGTYIQHGVTIGSRDDTNAIDAPIIGENCYIGAKATIIGCVTIGDNAKIGAGAVAVKDVPPGATAVGVPAKIIMK
ncbi:serine O-acetyltransferase [Bacteroides graminisolvens]